MKRIETLQDYIEFTRSTAVYPKERELEYLMFGLVDEFAEFTYKYNNGNNIADVIDEFSDICWYSARMIDFLNIDFEFYEEIDINFNDVLLGERECTYFVNDTFQYLGAMCGNIKKYIRDDNPEKLKSLESNMMMVANRLQYIAPLIGAYNLKNVLQINVNKLSDRKDRGVLKGDGDKR